MDILEINGTMEELILIISIGCLGLAIGFVTGVYHERRANFKTRIRSLSKDDDGKQSIDSEGYRSNTNARPRNLEVLKELIIHNSVKHDNTNERLIKLFEKLKTLEEAVEANSKITEFWQTVKKYAAYVLIGGLTVYGGNLAKHYIIDETPTPSVTQ